MSKQRTLSWGTIPDDLDCQTPYEMGLNQHDLQIVADIVNQGIDSHLEVVRTKQDGRKVTILDDASMRCFLRRCVESDDDNAHDLASCIMTTLNVEWV